MKGERGCIIVANFVTTVPKIYGYGIQKHDH